MIELGARAHTATIPATADHARYPARPSPPAPRLRTWWLALMLVVLGAGWGLQFTLLKIAVDAKLDELGILAGSMVLLAAIYALHLTWRGDWFRPTPGHLRFFLISSMLGFVLPLGCAILAARHLPAGLIVLHEALTPLVIVVLALAIGSEAVAPRRLAAVALGMSGVLLVVWPELIGVGDKPLDGLLLALLIPIAYGTDTIYVAARWPDGLSCIQVVAGEIITAALLCLPLLLMSGEPPFFMTASAVGDSALLTFVLVTVVETYLYFHLLRSAGAVFLSVASFIALFAGILWGIALNGESHPASVWLAVALVVVALSWSAAAPPTSLRRLWPSAAADRSLPQRLHEPRRRLEQGPAKRAVPRVLIAAMLAVFFTWTYPANQATADWTVVPDNWRELRKQWEYAHAANAVLTFLALCAATLSTVLARER